MLLTVLTGQMPASQSEPSSSRGEGGSNRVPTGRPATSVPRAARKMPAGLLEGLCGDGAPRRGMGVDRNLSGPKGQRGVMTCTHL